MRMRCEDEPQMTQMWARLLTTIYLTIYWPQNDNSYKVMMLCGCDVVEGPPQINQQTEKTGWR